jgi:hypothetical protein
MAERATNVIGFSGNAPAQLIDVAILHCSRRKLVSIGHTELLTST